ncbi:hypothetical protein [Streptomyces coelicolor]|jgi:hypothetical protein
MRWTWVGERENVGTRGACLAAQEVVLRGELIKGVDEVFDIGA